MPKIEIVAGPNGSGKTSFSSTYLLGKLRRGIYLNPDIIASGMRPLNHQRASFHAGRVLIQEIKAMIIKNESFAFESTLSGRTWMHILANTINRDYDITIYFLYLDSIKKNIQRIKKRFLLGGHPIPTEVVYRRHLRCFMHFWSLYRPLCTNWYIFDNSETKPELIQNKIDFQKLPEQKQALFISTFLKGEIP